MIVTIILYIIYAFVYIITSPFRLLSDVSIDSGIVQAFSTAGGYIKALDVFIPTTTLLAILALVTAIEAYIFGYKGIMWIIKRLPTQS
jgi:hypothetical protein